MEGVSSERERIAKMIVSGGLDLASETVRRLAQSEPAARADEKLVSWLVSRKPSDEPESWLEALRASPRGASPTLFHAARTYLALGLLRSSEATHGRGGRVGGVPVGAVLLDVGLVDEAAASLYASLAHTPANGRIALLLANALHRLEREEEARDMYRRALRVAPAEVSLDEIEDETVRKLGDHAEPLGLVGDARVWIPAIGYLHDVLPLSAIDPVPGAGFGNGTRAYDLLIAHRGARSPGERMAIRRDLREIAPTFFDALARAGKLDV